MIDFHNHLVPGVDDGARDLDESLAGLLALRQQGVEALISTPHLDASCTLEPRRLEAALGRIDTAWAALGAAAAAALPGLRLERGAEVMLDTLAPDLSDPRLRLAGTPFVLVEFPFLAVPSGTARVFRELRERGWRPVLAHPERYLAPGDPAVTAAEWRRAGALLQANAGSLLGRYGEAPRRAAWALLEAGMIDYLCSDYHARGHPTVAAARAELERRGAHRQAVLLTEVNAERLLRGEQPLPVAPVRVQPSLWQRLLRPRSTGTPKRER